MTGTRARGRPGKGGASLSRLDVLTKALELLDADGARALTMRALAKGLSVTPMALYHHVGHRDELIGALIEHVFGDIDSGREAALSPSERIAGLLNAYCQRAADHRELILAVFHDPNAFAGPLGDLTEDLRSSLRSMGLPVTDVERWLGLLVDYTHGYALSQAAAQNKAEAASCQKIYEQNIQLLTEMVKRAAADVTCLIP